MKPLRVVLVLLAVCAGPAARAQFVPGSPTAQPPPPSPRFEPVPPSPGPNYFWSSGYWVWNGQIWEWKHGRFHNHLMEKGIYMRGHWVQHPDGGFSWAAPMMR